MALQAMRPERWPESPAAPMPRRVRTPAWRWMLLAVAGWTTVSAVALVAAMEWRRAERIAGLAGMTPLSGRGVEIVLSDSRQPAGSGAHLAGHVTQTGQHTTQAAQHTMQASPPNQAVVTDGDLILLNMLLWYGGTRGVAINNQRVTAQTTITSSGPVILINGTRIVGPFRIAALGDPDTLKGVLGETGLIEQMRSAGISVKISAQPTVHLPPWQPGTDTTH